MFLGSLDDATLTMLPLPALLQRLYARLDGGGNSNSSTAGLTTAMFRPDSRAVHAGDMALPRPLELAAAINRWRALHVKYLTTT